MRFYRIFAPWMVVVALLALLPTGTKAAEVPADLLAKMVLDKAGVRATVCEMPQIGDGTLAAALARAGVAQVHGLAADAPAAEAARKPAIADGVMGSQVIIETGNGNALPLGDWVADLYLITDATDASLKTLSAVEAGRILSPYRGVALVGNSAGSKAGLTKVALEAWGKGCGGTAVITEDASGLWAVVKMPPLKSGDDWSHFYHGPDGNPLSQDTAFVGNAYQMQWHDTPMQGARNYTVVASAGRMFVASCSLYDVSHNTLRPQHPYELTARSIYNAKVLWRRPISAQFGEMGSLLVATADRLYAKEGSDVVVLNPETGAELSRIHAATDPLVVRWITLSDGVLLTLAGPRPYSARVDELAAAPKSESEVDRAKRTGLETLNREISQELVAWDGATGKELWRFNQANIPQRKLTVVGGKVFLYANGAYATALDLKNGKTLWKTDAPAPKLPSFVQRMVDENRRGEMQAVATANAYLIFDRMAKQYVAFAAADGHQLWNLSANAKAQDWAYPLIMGNDIVQRYGQSLNLLTSENDHAFENILTKQPFGRESDSCGHATAVASGLWIGNGVIDIKSGKQLVPHLAKSGCGLGFFVADGTELLFPSPCNCSYYWKGMEVIRATPQRPVREAVRLEQGVAPAPKSVVAADASDWPTYRSNETRKGSSAAVVPVKAAIRWTYVPPRPETGRGVSALPEYLQDEVAATQAIAVGDRAWLGTVEGAVICLDQKTGAERWRYWTAGKIKSSPTWSDGRVYTGSADGWVYCLDADTGALCWRYRVAPEDRRITVMGGLSSAWPVWSNVLVHEGVAYAAAGIRGNLDGSALCALDAKTGALRWQKVFNNAGATDDKGAIINDAPAGGGQLAWYQGKLWWHGIEVAPKIVDPATGAAKPAMDFPACKNYFVDVGGEDIGIMPGGWVAFGGSPPPRGGGVDVSCVWGQYGSPAVMLRSGPDGIQPFDARVGVPDGYTLPHFWRVTGGPDTQQLQRTRVSRQIPLWDANEILLPGDFDHAAKRCPLLCRSLTEALNAKDDAHPYGFHDVEKPNWMRFDQVSMVHIERLFTPFDLPEDKCHQVLPDNLIKLVNDKKLRLSGQMLLAGNAVIVTAAMDQTWAETDLTNWHTIAVSRTDRTVLWDVALPVAPGLNGMSLTRSGDVMIPLIDGRMVCIGDGVAETAIPSVAATGTQPGLLARGYASDALVEGFQGWTAPVLDAMTPVKTGVTVDADIREADYAGQPVLRLDGYLEIPQTGIYHLLGNCSWQTNASVTLFDAADKFIVCQIRPRELTHPLLLEKGKHPIHVLLTGAGKPGKNFTLQWQGPDATTPGEIPATALSHAPTPAN